MTLTAFLATPLLLASSNVTTTDSSVDATSESVRPVVYVIPMDGQMGTDIHPSIYEEIIEDAQDIKPDLVVFKLNSADVDTIEHIQNDDRREAGMLGMFQDYEGMLKDIHTGLRKAGVKREEMVMWVDDAYGIGAIMAFGFPKMFMTDSPDTRLGGLVVLQAFFSQNDAEIQAKMEGAWMGTAEKFFMHGGRDSDLAILHAMAMPEKKLFAKFDGRDVVFSADSNGAVWTLDASNERVASFDSDRAERVMLSEGSVENLEDLLFLLGYQDYEVNEQGQEIFEKYKERWRKAFDQCQTLLRDAQTQEQEGGVKGMGRALNTYKKVLGLCRQYPAVEIRLGRDFGVRTLWLEGKIKGIQKAIAESRRGGRAGSRGSGNRKRGGGGGLGG